MRRARASSVICDCCWGGATYRVSHKAPSGHLAALQGHRMQNAVVVSPTCRTMCSGRSPQPLRAKAGQGVQLRQLTDSEREGKHTAFAAHHDGSHRVAAVDADSDLQAALGAGLEAGGELQHVKRQQRNAAGGIVWAAAVRRPTDAPA